MVVLGGRRRRPAIEPPRDGQRFRRRGSCSREVVRPPSVDGSANGGAGGGRVGHRQLGAARPDSRSNILQIFGCDTAETGFVTVQYGANQQLFFAGIFGQGQRSCHHAGHGDLGPGRAANADADRHLPAVVPELQVRRDRSEQDLLRLGRQQQRERVAELVRSAGPAHRQPEPYGWNSDPGDDVRTPAAIDQWITNYPDPSIGDLALNYPNPTYVCRASGNQQNTWNDLANLKDETLVFPINRCDNDVARQPRRSTAPRSTNEAACPQTPGHTTSSGTSRAKLVELYQADDPRSRASGSLSRRRRSASSGRQQRLHVCSAVRSDRRRPVSAATRARPDHERGSRHGEGGTPGTCSRAGDDRRSSTTATTASAPITWSAATRTARTRPTRSTFDWSTDRHVRGAARRATTPATA